MDIMEVMNTEPNQITTRRRKQIHIEMGELQATPQGMMILMKHNIEARMQTKDKHKAERRKWEKTIKRGGTGQCTNEEDTLAGSIKDLR